MIASRPRLPIELVLELVLVLEFLQALIPAGNGKNVRTEGTESKKDRESRREDVEGVSRWVNLKIVTAQTLSTTRTRRKERLERGRCVGFPNRPRSRS
jgi:hypothetical protein